MGDVEDKVESRVKSTIDVRLSWFCGFNEQVQSSLDGLVR
jgi:hypothetical protein